MILLFLLFIFGLFIGSFLNVIIDRLPRNETFLKGRSHCEFCKHTLSWMDLIPFVSFLFLKGKCRYCRKKLSLRYPLFEILTATLFVLTTLQLQLFIIHYSLFIILFYLFIVSCLIVIFFIDLKDGIIPFQIVIPAILITFIYLIFLSPASLLSHLFSGLGAFIFFLLIFLFTRGRGMGFGDVIYAFFMGILLGFPLIILGLYTSFLTGAIISLILILWRKKKFRGSTIPFGPFLVLGTYLSMLWGEQFLIHLVLPYLSW